LKNLIVNTSNISKKKINIVPEEMAKRIGSYFFPILKQLQNISIKPLKSAKWLIRVQL